jgi:hypothetical protein
MTLDSMWLAVYRCACSVGTDTPADVPDRCPEHHASVIVDNAGRRASLLVAHDDGVLYRGRLRDDEPIPAGFVGYTPPLDLT